MVLTRFIWLAMAVLAIRLASADPASAHENHLAEQVAKAQTAQAAAPASDRTATPAPPKPFSSRLIDWAGRQHPAVVHFPIALVPAAWLALALGRRRGDPAGIARAILLIAGLAAVLASALGWLDAGLQLADRDPVKLWHRWIGTILGFAGAALALWAWRRPTLEARSLTLLLGAMTLALIVQGFLGGVLVHGARHMSF